MRYHWFWPLPPRSVPARAAVVRRASLIAGWLLSGSTAVVRDCTSGRTAGSARSCRRTPELLDADVSTRRRRRSTLPVEVTYCHDGRTMAGLFGVMDRAGRARTRRRPAASSPASRRCPGRSGTAGSCRPSFQSARLVARERSACWSRRSDTTLTGIVDRQDGAVVALRRRRSSPAGSPRPRSRGVVTPMVAMPIDARDVSARRSCGR